MKKIVTDIAAGACSPYNGRIGLIDVQDGKQVMVVSMQGCRAWIGEALCKLKLKTTASTSYANTGMKKYNYKKGKTLIAIGLNEVGLKTFKDSLRWLNEKEAKAKVSKSVLYQTQHKDVYIVEGSKYWKDSCWKIMLYTFYLRLMSGSQIPGGLTGTTGAEMYWPALLKKDPQDRTKEDILLSQLKKQNEVFDKDIFKVNTFGGVTGTHDYEGFHSVCTGRNSMMAKILGVDF